MGNNRSTLGYSRLRQDRHGVAPDNDKALALPLLIQQKLVTITPHERMLEEVTKRLDTVRNDCRQLYSSVKKQEEINGLLRRDNEDLRKRVTELKCMVTNQLNSPKNNQHIVAETTTGLGTSNLVPDLIDLDPIPHSQNAIELAGVEFEFQNPISNGHAMPVAPEVSNLSQLIDSIHVLIRCLIFLIFIVGILIGLVY